MIRAVCFDLDGTLVSSLPEIAEGVRRLARKEDFAPVPDEVVAVMIAAAFASSLKGSCAGGLPPERISPKCRRISF